MQKCCIRKIPSTFDRLEWARQKTGRKCNDSRESMSKTEFTTAEFMRFSHILNHLCIWNPSEKCKQSHIPRNIPMQDGRGLSQALLSPVIHFSVEAPCKVYPGSHLYVMLLPAKWPWSLTFRPNWGTPGSSQWDNSKPKQKKTHRHRSGV